MGSLLRVQLCAVASKNRSQSTSLLYSKSLHAMIRSFPLQDLQQLPFSTVYKDPLIHICFCHTLWFLNSTFFFLTLSHRSVLSLHTNITVSNLSSSFFKPEVLEFFSKTPPSPVCQNFISFASLLL